MASTNGLHTHAAPPALPSPAPVEPEAGAMYLLPQLGSGLTNQLLAVYASALFAHEHGLVYVLPAWAEWPTMNTTYPFAHMYTLHEGALVGTPLAGFRYVQQLPRALQATCNKQLEDDMVWRERVSAR